MVRRKNGSRDAILTEQNKIHLNSQKVTPNILNNIQKDIEKRLAALKSDLTILDHSKHLEGWKSQKFATFQELGITFTEIGFSFKPIYPYAVRRYRKKIGKRSLFVYWIDKSNESPATADKIFKPSFALRKIKSRLSYESIQTLSKAVEFQLVPFYKNNAKPEEEFESALNNERKFNELKSSTLFTGKKITVKLKPKIEKARKQEKELWEFLNPEFDKLDRKLKKFGTTVDRRIYPIKRNFDF